MTARKAIFGLCAACAMLFSAFAAQSAMAESQTAVTCAPVNEGAQFKDAHCKESGTGKGSKHIEFTEETTGELTNETTAGATEVGTLKATVGGLEVVISAKGVFAQGVIKNEKAANGEMFATGTTESEAGVDPGGGIHFTEVQVTNRECTFAGINPDGSTTVGTLTTQPIHASSQGLPFGQALFKPVTGNLFAEFELIGEKCPEALAGLYKVFGQVLAGTAEGATTPVVHNTVTTQEGTKLRLKNATTGPVAGLAGKVTIRAGKKGTKTSEWNPISLTKL